MEAIGFASSLLMGVVLGLMGGGGSILTVPILVYLFDLPPQEATRHSLAVVGLAALFGSVSYERRKEVDLKTGVAFAIPSLAGVYLARSTLLPLIPQSVFRLGSLVVTKDMLIMGLFAALMVLASKSMIESARSRADSRSSQAKLQNRSLPLITLQGFVVGALTGFVGAGGGFLIVPGLVLLAGVEMRSAVGTSLLIIAFNSIFGFATDVAAGQEVRWRLLTTITLCAVLGIWIGATFSDRVPESKLKKAFGWFVLAMGTLILIRQILSA